MKETKFTAEELSELESLEIRGGVIASVNGSQEKCINSAAGCGGTISQEACVNSIGGCGAGASQKGCSNSFENCGSTLPSRPGGNSDPSCYAPPPSVGSPCI